MNLLWKIHYFRHPRDEDEAIKFIDDGSLIVSLLLPLRLDGYVFGAAFWYLICIFTGIWAYLFLFACIPYLFI